MQKINKKMNLLEKLFWISCSVSGICTPNQWLEKIIRLLSLSNQASPKTKYQKSDDKYSKYFFLNLTLWCIYRTEGLVYAQRLWFSDQPNFSGGQGFKDDNSAYRACFIHTINFNSDFLHCRKGLLIYFCPFFERPEIFSCGCKKIKLAKVLDQT